MAMNEVNREAPQAFSLRYTTTTLAALLASPAVAIFVASNVANAGNLAFNMVFSRLLTPAEYHDLAVILTLKLAVLSIFGAVQMAVSQISARGIEAEPLLAGLPRLATFGFVTMFLFMPLMLPVALSDSVGAALGMEDGWLLVVLLFSVPVAAPLSIARGAALGRSAIGEMVVSANLEMVVRFAGAVVAWVLGLGLPGIIAAVGLSLVAGWYPVRREVARCAAGGGRTNAIGGQAAPTLQAAPNLVEIRKLLGQVALMALPFAALQLAQIGHLDGDLLMSAAVLDGKETDLVAGLALVQRIQFYACFGLAGVLLPSVTAAVQRGGSVFRPALPIVGLVVGAGAVLMLAVSVAPEHVILAVAGSSFLAAAPFLLPSLVAAFSFTGTYLEVTLLAGLGDRSGIASVILGLPVILAALWVSGNNGGLQAMVTTKATAQMVLFLFVSLRVMQVLRKRNSDDREMSRIS